MLSRITIPLLVTAVLVYACGPKPYSSLVAARPSVEMDSVVSADVRVEAEPGSRTVRFALSVTNGTGKRVELNFPNGQTHDFAVIDATGREVWRWSEGRLFTQLMQNQLLDARDIITYDERWAAPPSAGAYTLVAVLHSSTHPVEKRVSFNVQ